MISPPRTRRRPHCASTLRPSRNERSQRVGPIDMRRGGRRAVIRRVCVRQEGQRRERRGGAPCHRRAHGRGDAAIGSRDDRWHRYDLRSPRPDGADERARRHSRDERVRDGGRAGARRCAAHRVRPGAARCAGRRCGYSARRLAAKPRAREAARRRGDRAAKGSRPGGERSRARAGGCDCGAADAVESDASRADRGRRHSHERRARGDCRSRAGAGRGNGSHVARFVDAGATRCRRTRASRCNRRPHREDERRRRGAGDGNGCRRGRHDRQHRARSRRARADHASHATAAHRRDRVRAHRARRARERTHRAHRGPRPGWRGIQGVRRRSRTHRARDARHRRRPGRARRRNHVGTAGRRDDRHLRRVRSCRQRDGRIASGHSFNDLHSRRGAQAVTLFHLLSAQRRFVYLAVAIASAVGIWTALSLPSAIYPELLFPRITIVAQGTALGAREVVFTISRPIEDALTSVQGVRRVTSRSIRGSSEIQLYFDEHADMQVALQQTQQRVADASDALPQGVHIEVQRLSPSVFPILSSNLEGGDPAALYDLALYQIRPALSHVPAVGRVDVQGSAVREIEVIADPARLASLGMSYGDVAQEIQHSLSVEGLGRVTRSYSQYLVVGDQEIRSADRVGEIVIGSGVRVRDVATVSLGTSDRVSVIAGDGRPAVLLNVTRQIGGNTVAIADSIAQIAASLAKTLPPGIRLRPVYDQAALVRDALTSVRDAMLIGAVLAVLVLLVFLRNARVTAIAASSIPLTLAITVGIMARLGQTFNLMTLGAMAIAIGLVIDDAIVITENIVRHMRFTPDRSRAVRDAMQELIWPVTTSTLTTVVVFAPLSLLTGVVGQFFAALSITLSVAVLVSLVLALTIIPLLAEELLENEAMGVDGEGARPPDANRIGASIARGLEELAARYERSLGAALHHPRAMIGGAIALLIVGVLVQRVVGSGFLPEMDEGAFVLDYFTPGGTPLAESDRQVTIAERILASEPEVAGTSRRLGAELGLFATQQNRGDIVVRLKAASDRSR